MEAAKVVPYRRPILRAVQLCTPAVEEEDYEVMYSIDGIN
jgi:hypothetical protein